MQQDPLSQTRPTGRIHVLEVIGNAIVGGMETYVERLVEHLPPDRFAITALCPFESSFTERLRARDIEVLVTPMPDDPPWSSIQMTCAMIKAGAIDVLHAHLPNAHALAGIAGRLTGKPVLATLHGHRIGVLDLEIHRNAGTHLSVVCRQSYFHALGLGVSAGQLSCNPNGVDTEAFQPRPRPADSLRAALGIPAAARIVGFLGRLSPEKGPEVFLRAALLAHARLPDTHFVLVGDGPLAPALRESIARMKLEGRVHLAGLRRDVAAVLNDMDVLVSSSHSEAMPLAVMEAMASGLPVVATRVGGVPDMIAQGESGWLVAPNDFDEMATRLVQILATPGELERMGRAARARAVDKMALSDTVDRMAQLLARLAPARTTQREISAVVSDASRRRLPPARASAANGATAADGALPSPASRAD
ncbi:MAG TPA: glycosyltransferase [Burkholderiaceae bacterium]